MQYTFATGVIVENTPLYMNRVQAAEFLGISRPTIEKMLDDNRLVPSGKDMKGSPIFAVEYLRSVKETLVQDETGKWVFKTATLA